MKFFLYLIALLIINSSAFAGERFFESLYDVPLMDGMAEVKEEALAFDKPSGRIATAVGIIDKKHVAEIQTFYAKALRQMGWENTAPTTYVRDGEQIEIFIAKSDAYGKNAQRVEFRLSPAPLQGRK